uniref:FBA_2 domain-containing protein n=3 Tax=Caenorhabditis tropicalis TaxID=1561998 RepID=A0A1I7THR5_9PELO
MNHGDVFLLSLTSKRAFRMLKSSNRREIVKITCSNKDDITFQVEMEENKSQVIVVCKENKNEEAERNNEKVQMNGKVFEICRMENMTFILYYEEFEKYEITEAIFERVNTIFGRNKPFVLISFDDQFLPKFHGITETRISMCWSVKASRLEEYFEAVAVQDLVEMKFWRVKIKKESKFFHAKVLEIQDSSDLGLEILLHFKGREAYLLYSLQNEDSNVINFLKRWKCKEAFQDLEILELLGFEAESFDRIEQETNVKRFPNQVNLPITILKNSFGRYNTDPTRISTYIVRSDGIVAFIVINNEMFLFHVQKFTEKQMIESGYSMG